MTEALAKALNQYRSTPGTEDLVKANFEAEQVGRSPNSLAEMYAKEGRPSFVADYLPFTGFDDRRKAELLIEAHLGQADRFSRRAESAEATKSLADYFNKQAEAERQQAERLTQILSQLSSSSG